MIMPDVDVDTSTDDEIIASYLEGGLDEDSARMYLAVIRNTSDEFPLD